jgi:hypothetical protein
MYVFMYVVCIYLGKLCMYVCMLLYVNVVCIVYMYVYMYLCINECNLFVYIYTLVVIL